ncbi:uncharacterized protein N7529_001031 [Penicillium soppii]|uniref:uncharacterized protein n=1 Tax=Penicillium soppii TaxID=69789 RepID=UPI002546CB43|nr:uncharacterized protein N7529_001031 [Penicillium soppii]KAJ5882359.1 hypothetical protein N7529_001031 [Penicillium soppii]
MAALRPLFKVRVEDKGKIRFISLKDRDKAISEVFRAKIHRAITAYRIRKKELREGNKATKCVLIILISNHNKGAILNLALGLEEGIRIRRLLYI